MVKLLLLLVVIFVLYKSFSQLFKRNEHRNNYVSLDKLLFLLLIYVNVLVGFALVYTIFELSGNVIMINGDLPELNGFLEIFGTSLYFSGLTLLSVGYGDITPIGIGRLFAIIEALLGYIIPAAFVVRTMIDYDRRADYKPNVDYDQST
ncbi:two pore domain potassium channel family protein [Bacillus suaedaesalsae]|uniref:Two pore domain potassium channel family protein n=1 Tax=Bacillus suaedaesalsae TaxID=2810349 RepID=A0ABS2DDB7_9BACI|nr:two pore domain potassium channel family protein [Bacillus suaedaesalsae]